MKLICALGWPHSDSHSDSHRVVLVASPTQSPELLPASLVTAVHCLPIDQPGNHAVFVKL